MPATGRSAVRSFWIAGYEGADHVNASGAALDLNALNGHRARADEDYAALARFGIRTVRESVGWRLSERDGRFDFAHLDTRLRAARTHGIQVLWTLCHYGWPADVDPFDDRFVDRFVRFAAAAAGYLAAARAADAPPAALYTPINEISFLTWALCESDLMHPYRGGCGDAATALKRRLVRASLAGAAAIRAADPGAGMLWCDPVIHIVAPEGRPDLAGAAAARRAAQFEAWDMLAGRSAPELGGSPDALELVGVNWYHPNQWEHGTEERLFWHRADPRRIPLTDLLREVHARYGCPLIVAETSHVGVGRARWIEEVTDEVAAAVDAGVPVSGLCLYPTVDRPDWTDPAHWHHAGLWDVQHADGSLARVLDARYAAALERCQSRLPARIPPSPGARSRASITDRVAPCRT